MDNIDAEAFEEMSLLPICSTFLRQIGLDAILGDFFFGTDPDHTPVARTGIEVARSTGLNRMFVDVQIEIEESTARARTTIDRIEPLFGAKVSQECLAAWTASKSQAGLSNLRIKQR